MTPCPECGGAALYAESRLAETDDTAEKALASFLHTAYRMKCPSDYDRCEQGGCMGGGNTCSFHRTFGRNKDRLAALYQRRLADAEALVEIVLRVASPAEGARATSSKAALDEILKAVETYKRTRSRRGFVPGGEPVL